MLASFKSEVLGELREDFAAAGEAFRDAENVLLVAVKKGTFVVSVYIVPDVNHEACMKWLPCCRNAVSKVCEG